MKITPLIIIIFSCFFATAQVKNFAVSVSQNYSVIKGSTEYVDIQSYNPGNYPYTTTYGLKQRFSGKVGLDVSAKLDYAISKRFFISTGVSGSYMRFDRNMEVIVKDFGSQIQDVNTTGDVLLKPYNSSTIIREKIVTLSAPRPDKTALYVSVPAMIGTTFLNDKLLIRTGATLSYLINATQYITRYSFETQTLNEYRESSRKDYHSFLAGVTIQSTYRITKYLGADLSFQHSLTPIYTENKSRYNTFTAGLSYNLSF